MTSLSSLIADQWQPIESAPKDGAVFLGIGPADRYPQPMKWESYSPEDAEEIGEPGYWTYAEDLIADVAGRAKPPTGCLFPLLPALLIRKAPPMGENVSDNLSAIEKESDRCKFSTYGYACGKHVEHGRYLCEEHAKATCASCGQPATHGCDFCGQFVCGTPLCDECTFGTDDSKSAGAWGFMNHIHISRPEFADKHEKRRLKEEKAALASQAEALQRENAELRDVMKDCHAALKMMVTPGDISGSTVVSAFAAATSAECRARALLNKEGRG